ncbi:SDR family oxidoreductase [Vibrio fluvialis]|uniref:SDR family oxidoreductase n=1 Tax=Vibrio fluvialis TaxID=676 RepID=UPI000CEB5EEE|nr:SDR family oxidoreductase [Vibrio fluvialis]AVH32621.1 NAD(P)-dependent oxidoreductase [Vibrio fluvialis]EKO3960259.1 SDR family oxidoreductase [Vibrio fluvialis]MBL4260168.1 SDR family oxidoreductase [Vibrio fluvialis]MBL4281535.1 SDR family oxidoreductase [Vibrio fluvialis]MBY7898545.1 SDR family oxidoreductase [Vibrio fluvialis]
MNKVLVLGASGHVGQPLVAELLAKGEQVKAASRSGKAFGAAEGVVFDFADPTTFDAAFDGVDRAYVMLPGGYVESKALLEPVIQAAAERNVKVVFQSVLGVDADDSIPYRQVEIALENSGVPYVILRPNWFADNFHTYWKAGIDQGVIGVPAGEGKSSFIDVRDIASSAAAALTTNRFDNQAFNLTGPEALSYAQAAQKISAALGKPVAYQAMEEGAFCDLLKSVGVPADYAEFLTSIFYPVREGWTAGVSDAVATLTGKAPRSLDEYIADHLAELR